MDQQSFVQKLPESEQMLYRMRKVICIFYVKK